MNCIARIENINRKKEKINIFFDNFLFNPIYYKIYQHEYFENK